jgi:6-phosphogluconolactonase (cycloisomerase 2 family)
MYNRGADGQLAFVDAFDTQGSGSSSGGLNSQGSVTVTSDRRYLYAVNAGTNDITAFSIQDTPIGLTFIGKVTSGGVFPNSVTTFGNLLYVLNARGTAANITGFSIQTDGSLVAIANSTRPLSVPRPSPAQISFTPDGTTLAVTEKSTRKIDTYAVSGDGTTTGPLVQISAGPGPFGFSFDGATHLVVSEVNNSSASSYTISAGVLQVVTAQLRDFGRAACWAICTTDPGLPQQYAYVSNTNSDSISGYAIATDGSLSLVNADGKTAVLPRRAFPIDLAISSDNQYLYVLAKRLPGIVAFQIQPDGNLVKIQRVSGTPTSSFGMTGY